MGSDIHFTLYFTEIYSDAKFAEIPILSSGLPRIFVKYLLSSRFLPNHSSPFLALEYY